jgi:hypothetical protein
LSALVEILRFSGDCGRHFRIGRVAPVARPVEPGSAAAAYERRSSMTCEQVIDYTLFELDKIFAEAAVL